jgi:hypothetical protein
MAKKTQEQQTLAKTAGVAVLAGLVAAGVVVVLYLRPGWRRQAASIGQYLLQIAESTVLRRG